jgi:hypothetical protein
LIHLGTAISATIPIAKNEPKKMIAVAGAVVTVHHHNGLPLLVVVAGSR